MHSRNKFTPGVFVILTLLLIAALSLFMPFIDLDISIINLIFGKTDGEKSILSAFNIYGFFAILTVALPLLIMFLVSLSFMDRIKKYLINLLLSLWLFVGEILLMIIVTVPFADAKWGLGFLLGLVSSAALSLVSLVASFRDKTDKVHKIKVWYKGISTLIMIINVPSLFLELTVLFVFRDIFFMLSFFNIIGLIALIVATAISAYVTIKEFFGIHKYGFLHFLTGILTLVALAGIFYKSGTSGILIALILSIAFALLWGLMGAAAVFVINKQK